MTAGIFRNRSWLTVTAIYTALTLAYAWPLLPVMGSALPSDTGDPGLITWVLWWNAHVTPLTTAWWDAPIFFPIRGVFALSETFLGILPLTTPLQWLGASPVLAYNVAFLLSFPAAALAAHALARELTGRHDVAIIAGLAFGFNPYRASQMPHMHLLWTCWLALGLLFLHRYLRTQRRRELAFFAVCWFVNGLTTGYFLIYFAVLTGLWMLWFLRTRRDWLMIVGTIVVASIPLVPLLAGYQQHQAAFGAARGGGEIEVFSADLSALWAVSFHAWLPFHWTLPARPEGELYPGVTILVLIAMGAFGVWRAQPGTRRSRAQTILLAAGTVALLITVAAWLSGGWRLAIGSVGLTVNHPHKILTTVVWLFIAAILVDARLVAGWRRRSVFLFYAAAAGVLMFLALGPTPRAFGERFMYKAPYAWLMELPGGHALRVPARFGMLVMLCLTMTATMAFVRLTKGRARPGLLALVSVAVLADGWVPNMPAIAVPASIDLTGLDDRAAVMELPFGEIYGDTAAMLRATRHGHPLFNGFSGYGPPHYGILAQSLRLFDPSVLPALQEFGSILVLVDVVRDPEGRCRDLLDHTPGATRVRDTPLGPVYALAARIPAPGRTPGQPLAIASVAVSSNARLASLIADGKVDERWYTAKSQVAGDYVLATLERPSEILSVELDMGVFGGGYPRRLRVSVADAGGIAVPVWEGRTAGSVVAGAIRDFSRVPIVIDLPPNTRGRQVLLTILDDDEDAPWSLAELRIMGR
jgi:hypothetical protein